MAEEQQNYPPLTPQQVPPVTPTQAYPVSQPTSYAPQQYAPMPEQQYAPVVAQPMSVTPPQGKPIRKGRGGSAALVWLLGGCGLIALIFIVSVSYFAMNVGNAVGASTNSLPGAAQNLTEIQTALTRYTAAHHGQYPPSLDKIVDPSLLTYTSSKGATVYVEYTPPGEHSPEDAGVAGFYLGDVFKQKIYGQMLDQRLYVRLLRNGSIVQEQVQRMPISNR